MIIATILKTVFGSLIALGLLFFIFIRALSPLNNYRKALWVFVFGCVVILFFAIGIIYDYHHYVKFNWPYFILPLTAVFFTLLLSVIFLIMGKKRHQRFANPIIRRKAPQKAAIFIVKEERYYLIFRYEGKILLTKAADKDIYRGFKVKCSFQKGGMEDLSFKEGIKTNTIWHKKEDLLDKILRANAFAYREIHFLGSAIIAKAKYACFKIVLTALPPCLQNCFLFDMEELLNVNLERADKKIIYTSVVNVNFDIDTDE